MSDHDNTNGRTVARPNSRAPRLSTYPKDDACSAVPYSVSLGSEGETGVRSLTAKQRRAAVITAPLWPRLGSPRPILQSCSLRLILGCHGPQPFCRCRMALDLIGRAAATSRVLQERCRFLVHVELTDQSLAGSPRLSKKLYRAAA